MLKIGTSRVVFLVGLGLVGCNPNSSQTYEDVPLSELGSDVASDQVSTNDGQVADTQRAQDAAQGSTDSSVLDVAVDVPSNDLGTADTTAPADAEICRGLDGALCPTVANADTICTGGMCGFLCHPNFGDCDGNATNGCEVDLQADPTHCGTCTGTCTVRANANAICVSGACTYQCEQGYADCNGLQGDGCEINTSTDTMSCGSCGFACAGQINAPATCIGGACVFTCTVGWGNCDGITSDGCEVNVDTNANHCGTCNTVCPPVSHGSPFCSNGTCGISCNSGFQDCNADLSDGCEAALQTDPDNCGGCSHACPPAAPNCVNGSCSL